MPRSAWRAGEVSFGEGQPRRAWPMACTLSIVDQARGFFWGLRHFRKKGRDA